MVKSMAVNSLLLYGLAKLNTRLKTVKLNGVPFLMDVVDKCFSVLMNEAQITHLNIAYEVARCVKFG